MRALDGPVISIMLFVYTLGMPLVCGVLLVPPFRKICRRFGFLPPLSLLMLIPVVNVVFMYVVAFSKRRAVASNGTHT